MTLYDDVMRTIVELADEQVSDLDAWRRGRGISRAEAIRRAIAALLRSAHVRRDGLALTQGLWAEQGGDGLADQERLRAEWDEP